MFQQSLSRYHKFYPPKWLVFFRLRWSNRFPGQDLRVPGYVKGYVRRFWQVCIARTDWLLSPSCFLFPALANTLFLSSLIGVETLTIGEIEVINLPKQAIFSLTSVINIIGKVSQPIIPDLATTYEGLPYAQPAFQVRITAELLRNPVAL